MPAAEDARDGCRVRVRVYPGRGRFAVLGVDDEWVRVSLKAQPENNRANEELVKQLGKLLGAPVVLVHGATTPRKTVSVAGVAAADALATLREAAGRGTR